MPTLATNNTSNHVRRTRELLEARSAEPTRGQKLRFALIFIGCVLLSAAIVTFLVLDFGLRQG